VGAAIASVTEVADLSIWIDIPAEIGLHRVLARDGDEIRDQMKRWLKVQEEFFAQHNNRQNCAYQLPFGEPHQK
jgi:cytidylate kinase